MRYVLFLFLFVGPIVGKCQLRPFVRAGIGTTFSNTRYLNTSNYSGTVLSSNLSGGMALSIGKLFELELELGLLRTGNKFTVRGFYDQYEVHPKLINYYLDFAAGLKYCFSCRGEMEKRKSKPRNRFYWHIGGKAGVLINSKYKYADVFTSDELAETYMFDVFTGISYEKKRRDRIWEFGVRYFHGLNNVVENRFSYKILLRRVDIFYRYEL